MEERSKTNKEIYEQRYPTEELSANPMLCALKQKTTLIQYGLIDNPSSTQQGASPCKGFTAIVRNV